MSQLELVSGILLGWWFLMQTCRNLSSTGWVGTQDKNWQGVWLSSQLCSEVDSQAGKKSLEAMLKGQRVSAGLTKCIITCQGNPESSVGNGWSWGIGSSIIPVPRKGANFSKNSKYTCFLRGGQYLPAIGRGEPTWLSCRLSLDSLHRIGAMSISHTSVRRIVQGVQLKQKAGMQVSLKGTMFPDKWRESASGTASEEDGSPLSWRRYHRVGGTLSQWSHEALLWLSLSW